jgi:sugar lactone lactonase YvrE
VKRSVLLQAVAWSLAIQFVPTSAVSGGQDSASNTTAMETFATIPSAAATENICQGEDGAFYVTGSEDRVVWRIDSAGKVSKFAGIPSMNLILGVASYDGGLVLTAFRNPVRRPPPQASPPGARGGLDLSDAGPTIVVLDKSGNVTSQISGEKGAAFNGLAKAGEGWFLAADANGASIWRVDPGQNKITLWLKDSHLAPTATSPLGANGIKVHNDWVYVSVTGTEMIYRVQIGPDQKPKGELALFAKGFRPDDFDITTDGTMYAPTADSMEKVSPTGDVSLFLGGVGNPPSALVDKSGGWLYWPTRGGKDPQRLVRVPIH